MKRITFNKFFFALAAVTMLAASCAKKLDLRPQNEFLSDEALKDAAGYRAFLAKNYAGLATSGNSGPSGSSDIQGLDEGSQSPFIRGWFNAQELPTDEAVVSWDDQTIKDFHFLRWTPSDPFLYGLYSRLIYNVSLANEYLRESTDEKLASRGISGADADAIRTSRNEVRWLRAFNYACVIDLFGKSTFITENSVVNQLPQEISRQALFTYVETELKDLETTMAPAKSAEYGRVDRAAAWALLARLYLNAQVYTGTARWADAVLYSKKVIDAGYSLRPDYRSLFMADNDKQKDEFIFAVNCDGQRTQSFGNTSFFIHAPAGDDAAAYGAGGGWYGYRTTKQFVALFPDPSGATDKRPMFSELTSQDINDIGQFAQGVKVRKWRNIRTDGQPVSDNQNKNFSDIDYPVFRLAEMYLTYAEASARLNAGTPDALGITYFNMVRARAFGNTSGNIASPNLSDLINEWGRELYWEGHRRMDLVRFNLLTTGTYLWQWKGGSQSGTSVDAKYNLFPVPQQVRSANPNLSQNAGY